MPVVIKRGTNTFFIDQIYGDAGLCIESYCLLVLYQSPPELKQAGILINTSLRPFHPQTPFSCRPLTGKKNPVLVGAKLRDRVVRRAIPKILQLALSDERTEIEDFPANLSDRSFRTHPDKGEDASARPILSL